MICATIRTHRESWCFPYEGFFIHNVCFRKDKINLEDFKIASGFKTYGAYQKAGLCLVMKLLLLSLQPRTHTNYLDHIWSLYPQGCASISVVELAREGSAINGASPSSFYLAMHLVMPLICFFSPYI